MRIHSNQVVMMWGLARIFAIQDCLLNGLRYCGMVCKGEGVSREGTWCLNSIYELHKSTITDEKYKVRYVKSEDTQQSDSNEVGS